MIKENVELPDVLKPKGHVKIELINKDNGNVVDTVEQDNFISKGMEWLYVLKMKEIFQYGMFNHGTGTDALYTYPFENIILTDASHPEDPDNEWLVKGNIIGEAKSTNETQPAGDTWGRFSVADSFVRDNMVRFVFHFTETKGNGEISSVYFRPNNLSIGPDDKSSKLVKEVALDGEVYNHGYGKESIVYHGDYIIRYVSLRDPSNARNTLNTLQLYDLNYKLIGSRPVRNISRDSSNIGMCIAEGNAYIVNEQNVYKIPVSDLIGKIQYSDMDSPHLSDELTKSFDTGLQYHGGIIFDDKNRRFVVVSREGSNTSYTSSITLFDMSFNILSQTRLIQSTFVGPLVALTDDLVFFNNDSGYQNYSVRSMSTGKIVPQSLRFIRGFDNEGNILTGSTTGVNLVLHPPFSISSRAKLSSPIIKTEQHVMKVTYDFILPSLFGDNN